MSNIIGRVYKYVQNAVIDIVDNSKHDGKIIDFGKKNTFPNDLIRIVNDSGTATACISKLNSFIFADGFIDRAFASKIINKDKKTADIVLAEIIREFAFFQSFYLKVLYTNDGVTPLIEVMPVATIRKKSGGGYLYNENFGSKNWKRSDDLDFEGFEIELTPHERQLIIQSDNQKFHGQRGTILYFFEPRPGYSIYGVPDYFSAIEDLESDAGIVKMEKSNILDSFRPNVIIKTGPIDNINKDGNGETLLDKFDTGIDGFVGPGGAKIAHIMADGISDIVVFPLNELLDGIDKTRDRVPRAVCRHFGVPPVLIGMSTPEGLGSTQALANSIKLFNHSILKYQIQISSIFKMLFPNEKTDISTLNLIDFIDPVLIDVLTNQEKRAILGYEPLEDTGTTSDKSLAEIIGVGGVTALSAIIANPAMTQEQKIQFAIIIFALSEVDAKKLVTGIT